MSEWIEFILVLLMMGGITYVILVLRPRWVHQQVKQTAQQIAQKLQLEYVAEKFEPEPELDVFFTHWPKRDFTHHMRGTSADGQPYELFYIRYITRSSTGRKSKRTTHYPMCVLAIPHNPHKYPVPEFQITPMSLNTIGTLFKDAYRGESDSPTYKIARQGFELHAKSQEKATFFDQLPAEVWQSINPYKTVIRLEGSWLVWYEFAQTSTDSVKNYVDMAQRGLAFYEVLGQHSQHQ